MLLSLLVIGSTLPVQAEEWDETLDYDENYDDYDDEDDEDYDDYDDEEDEYIDRDQIILSLTAKEVPNKELRTALKKFDTDGDGKLALYEVENIKGLTLKTKNDISDLSVFRLLTSLRSVELELSSQKKVKIDAPTIQYLYIDTDGASIEVDAPYVKTLRVYFYGGSNNLEWDGKRNVKIPASINLSGCDSLESLDINTGINLGDDEESAEYWLKLTKNKKKTALTLPKKAMIRKMWIYDTCLNSFHLPHPEAMEKIELMDDVGLQKLDLTGASQLNDFRFLRCHKLETIIFPKNAKIKTLDYGNFGGFPRLKKLDVKGLSNLRRLECQNTPLTELNVSNLSKLCFLNCDNNKIKKLDVSKNKELIDLSCSLNQLTSLKINNPKLLYLKCNANKLSSLDVTKAPKLNLLKCSLNRLTKLKVSGKELRSLSCDSNKLTGLDLGKTPRLGYLNCAHNKLTKVDTRKCDTFYIDCHGNALKSLYVKNAGSSNILSKVNIKPVFTSVVSGYDEFGLALRPNAKISHYLVDIRGEKAAYIRGSNNDWYGYNPSKIDFGGYGETPELAPITGADGLYDVELVSDITYANVMVSYAYAKVNKKMRQKNETLEWVRK